MILRSSTLHFSYPNEKELIFPSIQVDAAETKLILGSSGQGKTTLLNLLAGLIKPHLGEIEIQGKNLVSMSSSNLEKFRAQHIGLIFQKSYFLPYLSIRENISFALKLQGHFASDSDISQELKRLNAGHIINKKPANCSIGEQQRASIARAVLQKPSLLLADEPTSALDDENANKVGSLLKTIAEENRSALLVVTHDNRLKDIFSNNILL